MAEQRTPEWFKQRRGLITASSVGAILGIDPYRTPDDVMRAMVREWHGAEFEFTGNVATEWGAFNEDGARAQYEMEFSEKVEPCGFFMHPYYDWLGASPDGLIGECGLLEIKCPYGLRNNTAPTFKTMAEQPHYYAQAQIQMVCADKFYTNFYQWAPHGSRLEHVDRDFDCFEKIISCLRNFYSCYLWEREHPERHLQPKRRAIETNNAKRLIDEYEQLTDAIDHAAARKKEVLAELVELAGERDSIICGHNLTRVQKEGAVSYAKAIKELLPNADMEPYRGKPTEYWLLK